MKNDKKQKKSTENFPGPNQQSSTSLVPSFKMNFKKIIGPLLIICIFLIAASLVVFLLRDKVLRKFGGGFEWCKNGTILKIKDTTLTVVGVEDYQSKKFAGKVCHLIFAQTDLQTDYYFDENALNKLREGKDKGAGNGCLIYQIKNIREKTELCFGGKVKPYRDEEVKKEEEGNDLLKEILENATASASSKSSPATNFVGTKWHYQIDVGGGVGGVMTFTKDDNGSLEGKFTESGPLGVKEKYFFGSYEKDKFLLTLEEFPTFKVELSADGKTITGKPLEQSKDIYYPDDFFKATLEP